MGCYCYTYLASVPWWRHAQSVIDELSLATELSFAVGILDRDHIVYVAYAPGGSVRSPVVRSLGTRLPAHATVMGQVLLASLDETARAHYLQTAELPKFTPFTR